VEGNTIRTLRKGKGKGKFIPVLFKYAGRHEGVSGE
jgi:hypothetical protein